MEEDLIRRAMISNISCKHGQKYNWLEQTLVCIFDPLVRPSLLVDMAKRKMEFGGYKQQLAKAKEEEEAERKPSKLAAQLVEKWAWGAMSAPEVQLLASAALEDGLQHPDVAKLAKIGGSGKYPGNTHRDLLKICGKPTLAHAIAEVYVRVKVSETMSQEILLKFLLPHKVFAGLYHSIPKAFIASVLGGNASKIGKFWSELKNHPNLLSRPALRGRADLDKVVPLGIHGDGVAYMQVRRAGGKSLEVLSWCSLLTQGPTRSSTFLMFLLVKAVVKDSGMSQTWPKVWKVLCWSLQALASGKWPMLDWDNKEFAQDSIDYKKRGKDTLWQMGSVGWYLCTLIIAHRPREEVSSPIAALCFPQLGEQSARVQLPTLALVLYSLQGT